MTTKLSDLLYAPIGLITDASRRVPELAEQGRIQVANARMIGQMAAQMGSARIAEHLTGVTDQVHGLLVQAGLVPGEFDEQDDAASRPPAAAAPAPQRSPKVSAAVPEAGELAVVDYDSLAASQVVPRLAALKPDELDAVRRYELAHRARKTILGRVAQLQG